MKILFVMVVTPTLTVSAGSFHRRTDFPKERNNKVRIRSSAGTALEVSGTLLTTIVETVEDGSSQWRVAALDLETGCVGATTDAYPWDAKLSTFQGHTTGDGTAAWQVVTNGKAFMLGVDALGGGDISVKYSCNLDTPYECLAHDGNIFWGCTSKTHISKWTFSEECKPESGGLANVLLDQPVIGGTAAIDQSTGTFWQRFSKPSTDDNTTLWYGNWGTSLDTHNVTAEIMEDDDNWNPNRPSDISYAEFNAHGSTNPNVWWTGPIDNDPRYFLGMFTGPDINQEGAELKYYPPPSYIGGNWAHGGSYELLLLQLSNGTEAGAATGIGLGNAATSGFTSTDWCTEYPGSDGSTEVTLGEWVFVDAQQQASRP